MPKKAQVWYTDFLIGLLILIAITFIFTRTILDLNAREDKFQELINDGLSISNSLMSEGYCASYGCGAAWNRNPPIGRLGFVKNGKVVKENFDAFINTDYEKTKTLLGSKNDYILYFEYNGAKIDYNGKYVFGNENGFSKAENTIKLTRVVYNAGKIVNMIVIVF
jgi:hypothetical protein